MPIPKTKVAPPQVSEHKEEDDYVFPTQIMLDNVSFDEFSAEVSNPREPNAALRALFKK